MSILEGVSVTVLQQQLAALQQAYIDLSLGGKVETVAYAQGDGNKAVTYTRANISNLTQAIITVQTAIDCATGVRRNRRRPMTPIWRGR